MKLKYNKKTNRYNNFHCGDIFQIMINNKFEVVRIEFFKNDWYVINEKGFIEYCKLLEGKEIKEYEM